MTNTASRQTGNTQSPNNNATRDARTSIIARARQEIVAMKAYSSARSLYKSNPDTIFLDANEAPFSPFVGAQSLNRYPDQQPEKPIKALCRYYDVSSRNLITARGADEVIDILMRSFCRPAIDNIIICPPTFAMYEQAALMQGAEVKSVPLTSDDFILDISGITNAADENTKLVFICSPNNPTGNSADKEDIITLCRAFDGKAVIVLDETYNEYSKQPSLIPLTEEFENLIVLRTLSKSHACAGLRCGVGIAQAEIIALLRKVLAPYPLPQPVMAAVLNTMNDTALERLAKKRDELIQLRDECAAKLQAHGAIGKVFPSDANYILVKVKDSEDFKNRFTEAQIIVRNQSHQEGLQDCFRISIGTAAEMELFFRVLDGEKRTLGVNDRIASVNRTTKETAISVSVNLDQTSPVAIDTGVGFYDHMLDQIAKHGGIALQVECHGDLHIDPHHTIEDCAIALGQALKQALGDKSGIGRYGFTLPMDETQAGVSLDLGGRFYLQFDVNDGKGFPENHVGDLPTDMIEHIFLSIAENMNANIHIKVNGENTHHMVEACFKAFARALRQAVKREGEELPSTKGIL